MCLTAWARYMARNEYGAGAVESDEVEEHSFVKKFFFFGNFVSRRCVGDGFRELLCLGWEYERARPQHKFWQIRLGYLFLTNSDARNVDGEWINIKFLFSWP